LLTYFNVDSAQEVVQKQAEEIKRLEQVRGLAHPFARMPNEVEEGLTA
jgi:hypothetical protein